MKAYNPTTLEEIHFGPPKLTLGEFEWLTYPKKTSRTTGGINTQTIKKKKRNKSFLWISQDGEAYYDVTEMQTDHLFNAFKMVWNHSVAPHLRIGSFRYRADVKKWSKSYRVDTALAMIKELVKRWDELSDEQQFQLKIVDIILEYGLY